MTDDVGTFRCYTDKKFRPGDLQMIAQANQILQEYERVGMSITLRGLYYQFVSRGLFENVARNYDVLGRVVNDGRLAGLLSWTAVEDTERPLRGTTTYRSPREVLEAARSSYVRDKWKDQEFRPEVWVEKNALINVIAPVCQELQVDYFSCKGYTSQSAQWRAGQRLADYVRKGQRPIIFHLGDHDPSGLDMTRDNTDRLSMFVGTPVQVVRLALNWPQIERYSPPPNPTKLSDSRAKGYVEEFGEESWELDALAPTVIAQLIRDAVLRVRDEAKWDASLRQEAEEQRELAETIEDIGS